MMKTSSSMAASSTKSFGEGYKLPIDKLLQRLTIISRSYTYTVCITSLVIGVQLMGLATASTAFAPAVAFLFPGQVYVHLSTTKECTKKTTNLSLAHVVTATYISWRSRIQKLELSLDVYSMAIISLTKKFSSQVSATPRSSHNVLFEWMRKSVCVLEKIRRLSCYDSNMVQFMNFCENMELWVMLIMNTASRYGYEKHKFIRLSVSIKCGMSRSLTRQQSKAFTDFRLPHSQQTINAQDVSLTLYYYSMLLQYLPKIALTLGVVNSVRISLFLDSTDVTVACVIMRGSRSLDPGIEGVTVSYLQVVLGYLVSRESELCLAAGAPHPMVHTGFWGLVEPRSPDTLLTVKWIMDGNTGQSLKELQGTFSMWPESVVSAVCLPSYSGIPHVVGPEHCLYDLYGAGKQACSYMGMSYTQVQVV